MRAKEHIKMRINIKVIPNSKHSQITKDEGHLTIHVKNPPDKGKANKEVTKLLTRFFDCKVQICSGAVSRRKQVELECNEQEFSDKLNKLSKKR